jgi:hypothetical protein
MAQIFTVQLTQANSEGNYDIYYNQIGSSFYATATTSNTLTQNLPFSILSSPYEIAIPNTATQIIILGLGPCNNTFTYPVTPIVEPPPVFNFPILCFSYGEENITEYLTFQPQPSLFNGKGRWTSGSYTIYWNLTSQRWELVISTLLTFVSTYTSSSGVPDQNWVGLGSLGSKYITNVTTGICNPVTNLNTIIEQTPNSCFNSPKERLSSVCDGIISVLSTTGGQPPYEYSIDNITFQRVGLFRGLCAGSYTVTTKDNVGNVTTNTITVGDGSQPTTYNVRLLSTRSTTISETNRKQDVNNFRFDFPSIRGVSYDIELTFTSVTEVKKPGDATFLNTINLLYNGDAQSPSSYTTNQIDTTVPDCPYTKKITTQETKFLINYTENDSIEGVCTSLINLVSPQSLNGCSTGVETTITLDIQIFNIRCSCCEVKPFTSTQLISNILNATVQTTYKKFCLNYGLTCYDALNPPLINN